MVLWFFVIEIDVVQLYCDQDECCGCEYGDVEEGLVLVEVFCYCVCQEWVDYGGYDLCCCECCEDLFVQIWWVQVCDQYIQGDGLFVGFEFLYQMVDQELMYCEGEIGDQQVGDEQGYGGVQCFVGFFCV